MAQHAEASGSLALSFRPHRAACDLPKPINSYQAHRASAALPRAVQLAEIAQARVFERLLRAEGAELQELAHRIAAVLAQLPDSDSSQPPRELMHLRARIDEVQSLLQALQKRFPHSAPQVDPQQS